MKCKKCGHDNDYDATFCEKCGTKLKGPTNMPTSTKVLIIAIIILVGILGVVGGMILFGSQATPVNNSSPVINETTPQPTTTTAGWHQITSYSGVSTEFHTFNVQGNKVKVVMKATPNNKNTSSHMTTDIISSEGIISNTGSISWNSTSPVTTKEKTLEATVEPGICTLHIFTGELQQWTVIVYDYY